jgi:hypothetical protein
LGKEKKMKLAISTIVTGVVLFALGGLFYGAIFADYFKQHYGEFMRPEEDMKIWAYGVGSFLQAYILSLIYSRYFIKRNSPLRDGLALGFLAGFFLAGPYVFFTWGGMAVTWRPIVLDAAIIGFMIVVAGMIIGLIYGRSVTSNSDTASA